MIEVEVPLVTIELDGATPTIEVDVGTLVRFSDGAGASAGVEVDRVPYGISVPDVTPASCFADLEFPSYFLVAGLPVRLMAQSTAGENAKKWVVNDALTGVDDTGETYTSADSGLPVSFSIVISPDGSFGPAVGFVGTDDATAWKVRGVLSAAAVADAVETANGAATTAADAATAAANAATTASDAAAYAQLDYNLISSADARNEGGVSFPRAANAIRMGGNSDSALTAESAVPWPTTSYQIYVEFEMRGRSAAEGQNFSSGFNEFLAANWEPTGGNIPSPPLVDGEVDYIEAALLRVPSPSEFTIVPGALYAFLEGTDSTTMAGAEPNESWQVTRHMHTPYGRRAGMFYDVKVGGPSAKTVQIGVPAEMLVDAQALEFRDPDDTLQIPRLAMAQADSVGQLGLWPSDPTGKPEFRWLVGRNFGGSIYRLLFWVDGTLAVHLDASDAQPGDTEIVDRVGGRVWSMLGAGSTVVESLTGSTGATGDVVGPASSTTGRPAVFADETGKVLAQGGVNTPDGLLRLNGFGVAPPTTLPSDLVRTSELTTAVNAKVADAINDGTTMVAPSQNAVFDALALKVPTSRTLAGVDLADDVTAAELRAALGIEWVLLADETLASNAASWTGPTGLGSYDEIRVVVTGRTTQAAATGVVNLRFNGNSTPGHYINGSGGSSTWLPIGSIAGSLTNTNRWGRVEAIVQNKAGTLHTVSSQYATTDANTSPPNSSHVVSAAGHFTQTAAITSLVVYPNSSLDFVAGTRFRVFGRL